jgi:hypothetical protein
VRQHWIKVLISLTRVRMFRNRFLTVTRLLDAAMSYSNRRADARFQIPKMPEQGTNRPNITPISIPVSVEFWTLPLMNANVEGAHIVHPSNDPSPMQVEQVELLFGIINTLDTLHPAPR